MKTSWLIIVLLVLTVIRTQGQVSPSETPAIASQGTQDTSWSVVSRAASQNIWQRAEYETLPSGLMVSRTRQFIELATGLNHLVKDQWVPSQEEIDISPDGNSALATNGQHQVYFPGDIYNGVIQMVTPDGKTLRSQPIGLGYDDGNNSVLIAVLTNSTGAVLPSGNQVIYQNAFTGFAADLLYTYTKAGFEQDVVIRTEPPTPESFGLNPATAKLQILTEFFNPPQPITTTTILPAQAGVSLADQGLDFGVTKMGMGRAFMIGDNANACNVQVGKSWVKLEGRQFLVEEVPVNALADGLAQLPVSPTASAKPKVNSTLHVVSAKRLLPAPRQVKANPGGQLRRVAQATTQPKGLVLDYQTINSSQTNFTFQGDTTYFISGNVNLYGTNTLEGGAVLKYATNSSASINTLIGSVFNCKTAPYRPAIFTAVDDNTVGETISVSRGTPTGYYGGVGLNLNLANSGLVLHDIRMSYLTYGVGFTYACPNAVRDAQFVNCQYAVGSQSAFCRLQNVLVQGGATVFYGYFNASCENVTFHQVANLSGQWVGACFTNSLVIAVGTNGGATISGVNNQFLSSDPGSIFRTVGAGSHYLATNSPYRNAGTNNIDPVLLADLGKKTTYPPVVYPNVTFTVATNFSPIVQRDTNAQPDLGYHYDPIDYLMDKVAVSNATLTVSNGTAIACYNEPGIQLQNGSAIISVGAPLTPNWFARYQSVQEQPLCLGGTNVSSGQNVSASSSLSTAPSGTFRFSKFACPAGGGRHLYSTGTTNYGGLLAQDCEFWGGQNDFTGAAGTTTTLKNNLFYRSSLTATATNLSSTLSLSNNLVYGAAVTLRQPTNTIWYAFNNEFDTCGITNSTLTNGYNAYVNCSGRLSPTNANDVVLTSFMYTSGTLGNFYQSSTSLVDKGSCTADLTGLYHYTTQTNQVKEGATQVDIGYHYVAVDTNGIPIDTDGDGIPDYLEDSNGNGVYDAGDLGNWLINAFNGLSPGNGLLVFTPLK